MHVIDLAIRTPAMVVNSAIPAGQSGLGNQRFGLRGGAGRGLFGRGWLFHRRRRPILRVRRRLGRRQRGRRRDDYFGMLLAAATSQEREGKYKKGNAAGVGPYYFCRGPCSSM